MQVLVDHLDDFVGEMRSPGLLVEVGCGAAPSATLLSRLAPSAAVMGVDISLSAMRAARELTSASHAEVHLARMNLLAALRPASVDLLVFMPPYVPSTEAAFAEAMSSASSVETPVDSLEQAAWVWSGGPGGLAILERLVSRDLDRVLAEGGVFVCLVPAHDGGRSAAEAIKRACSGGFTARVIARHNEDLKGGWAGGWAVLQIERD
jgi:methylase of polypeptide subunit release factors